MAAASPILTASGAHPVDCMGAPARDRATIETAGSAGLEPVDTLQAAPAALQAALGLARGKAVIVNIPNPSGHAAGRIGGLVGEVAGVSL